MSQTKLAAWLKTILIGLAVCGICFYGGIVPVIGQGLIGSYPELSGWFAPWMIFLLVSAIPCYMVLFFGWGIATNIGKDRSFSHENAVLLQRIAHLAAIDSGYFFIGNLVLGALNMNHPGVVLASMLVVFLGVAISVAAAALSHLVEKAAEMQEQNDLTI